MVSKKSVTPEVSAVPKPNNVKYNYDEIAQDPYKHVITFIEKKIRNMDKRKARLEGYRKVKSEGGSLDPDQEIAMKKYEEVAGGLDFAKELVKVFTMVSGEVDKVQQKIEKQNELDKEENGLKLAQFISRAQKVLELISTEERIRHDIILGENAISEEELEYLVEFHKNCLAANIDVGVDTMALMDSVGMHMHLLNQASSKEVSGTTYENLNRILSQVSCNAYFLEYPDFNELNNQVPEDAGSECIDDDETLSSPCNEEYQDCVEDNKEVEQHAPLTDATNADDENNSEEVEEESDEEDDEETTEIMTTEFVASQEPQYPVDTVVEPVPIQSDATSSPQLEVDPEAEPVEVEAKPKKINPRSFSWSSGTIFIFTGFYDRF